MSGKPVAIYLRVSTDDQDHASQRAEVLKWLDRNGVDPDKVEWYVDTESGRRSRRPQLDRLCADIDGRRRKTVVAFSLDRISRDMLDGMELLGRWCRAGVRVACVTQDLDIAGTVGRIVAAVLFGLAELEWKVRLDRQRAGIAVARANGKYKGRKPGTAKADAERARALAAGGLYQREIARSMGISERTVRRYLCPQGESP
jgi:DNA invertase Pin-like site-specific DNA recombinase